MKVIYRWRDMIYAGGEFSFDKISKFSYPKSLTRLDQSYFNDIPLTRYDIHFVDEEGN